MQGELEENEKSMAELTEQLKKLEDEAGEVMKACQEAEVSTLYSLCAHCFVFSLQIFTEHFQIYYVKYIQK